MAKVLEHCYVGYVGLWHCFALCFASKVISVKCCKWMDLRWMGIDERIDQWRKTRRANIAQCVSAQDLGGGVVYTGLLSTGMVPANKQSCQMGHHWKSWHCIKPTFS